MMPPCKLHRQPLIVIVLLDQPFVILFVNEPQHDHIFREWEERELESNRQDEATTSDSDYVVGLI